MISNALTLERPATLNAELTRRAETSDPQAPFAIAFMSLVDGVEVFAQDLNRHGLSSPRLGEVAMLLGIPLPQREATGSVEPLSYEQLRDILDRFAASLDRAHSLFIEAAEGPEFVLPINVLAVRLDFDGDGQLSEAEGIGTVLSTMLDLSMTDRPIKDKSGEDSKTELVVGFDRADAYWLAGYTQVVAAQVDFLLAHDFEEMFSASFHRIFPGAGLPMADYSRGGMLMIDAESDAAIADLIAFIHAFNLDVTEPERLVNAQQRLLRVIAHSRLNWDAILQETDDFGELVPSPSQTSLVPGVTVTDEIVAAWRDTLDTMEAVLVGDLLVPHWRFTQGMDANAYFTGATRTDFVMLLTGYDVLPFLADGPIADAEAFQSGLDVFGDDFPFFAFWFN